MNRTEEAETRKRVAERIFEAFRAIGPFKRRPGLGHASRPGEFQVLHRLAHHEGSDGLRVGDIAGMLGIKPPTVSRLVDALEARGLVERFADGADRRVIRVRLSEEGRANAAFFHNKAVHEAEALVDYLGLEDAARLAELLSRTASFLETRPCGPDTIHPGFHKRQGEQ